MKTPIKLLTPTICMATAITPVAVMTCCHKNESKKPIQVKEITWEDGWYVSAALSKTGGMKTNDCNAIFKLKNELPSGQTLSIGIEETDKTGAVSVVHESLSIGADRKTITIPLRLETSWSYMRFGWYAYYNITFMCSNGTSTLWTQKIEDCYLYLLTDFESNPTVSFAGEIPHVGDLEFRTTVNIEPSLFDKKQLLFKCEIIETTKRPAGFDSVNIVTYPGQKYPYKSEQKLYQYVTVSKAEGLTTGAEFEFKARVTLTLALYPEKPISFDFENIKFKYQ